MQISILGGCSAANAVSPETGDPIRSVSSSSTLPPPPPVRVIFRDGRVYAREGSREWPIAEVGRNEMLWAPDGYRFAYVKQQEVPASAPSTEVIPEKAAQKAAAKKTTKKKTTKKKAPDAFHIVIRNIRGDSVNAFPIYRPGRPSDMDWINNDTIGYLAPKDKTGDAYVLHSAATGEVLQVFRGTRFNWSPGHKQLAYIANPKRDHLVKVNSEIVWPREAKPSTSGRRRRAHRRVMGQLVWSPDGSGLAFMTVDRKPRLVVLLVVNNKEGDLVWPLPHTALLPGNHLFWGDSKVVIGESMLKPRFAASWKRIR